MISAGNVCAGDGVSRTANSLVLVGKFESRRNAGCIRSLSIDTAFAENCNRLTHEVTVAAAAADPALTVLLIVAIVLVMSESTERRSSSVRHLLAGAVSGSLAKSAVAPFERAKILFQTRHSHYPSTIIGVLRFIYHHEGVRGLWRVT